MWYYVFFSVTINISLKEVFYLFAFYLLFVSRPVGAHIVTSYNYRTAYGVSSRRCFVSAWLEQVRLCSRLPQRYSYHILLG